eukprot:Pgem_evm1s11815
MHSIKVWNGKMLNRFIHRWEHSEDKPNTNTGARQPQTLVTQSEHEDINIISICLKVAYQITSSDEAETATTIQGNNSGVGLIVPLAHLTKYKLKLPIPNTFFWQGYARKLTSNSFGPQIEGLPKNFVVCRVHKKGCYQSFDYHVALVVERILRRIKDGDENNYTKTGLP